MKIYRSVDSIKLSQPAAVTLGTFDGVHLGHQRVLQELKGQKKSRNCNEILLTFQPHPKIVVNGKNRKNIKLLTPLEEKLELLKQFELDAVLVIPFTRKFSQTSYIDFVKNILIDRLHVKTMVIGHDHAFGKNREGNPAELKRIGNQYGFDVYVVPPYYVGEQIASSSLIRQSLTNGDIQTANLLLGREYSLEGKVVAGDRRGRDLGFPTANLQIGSSDKFIPKSGVYAIDIALKGNTYRGMMNIGHRPTFNFDPLTLETHIINFAGSIYDEILKVKFLKFIREERKFLSSEELKIQLFEDKRMCENV